MYACRVTAVVLSRKTPQTHSLDGNLSAPALVWTQLYGRCSNKPLPLRKQHSEPTCGRAFGLLGYRHWFASIPPAVATTWWKRLCPKQWVTEREYPHCSPQELTGREGGLLFDHNPQRPPGLNYRPCFLPSSFCSIVCVALYQTHGEQFSDYSSGIKPAKEG